MPADTTASKQLSIPELINASWDTYKKIFIKLLLLLIVIAFPIIAFHLVTMHHLTEINATTSLIRGANIFLTLLDIFPSLTILMLIALQIDTGKASLIEAVGLTLFRLFKVGVTIATFIICLVLPYLLVTGINMFLLYKFQDSKPARIAVIILSCIVGIPSILYFIIFMVYWVFTPLTSLWRGKWCLSAMKYSFSLVRSNWWFMLLFCIFMGATIGLPYLANMAAAGSGKLVILFMCIVLLAMTFSQVVYVTLFHALEQKAGMEY